MKKEKLLEKLGFNYNHQYNQYELYRIGFNISEELVKDVNVNFNEFEKYLKKGMQGIKKDFNLYIDEKLNILIKSKKDERK